MTTTQNGERHEHHVNGQSADGKDLLYLDAVEIDDKEFNIPPIKNLPTLESILNTPDDHDELNSALLVETRNLLSAVNRISRNADKSNLHGCVLRHVTLKSISSQLLSAADKVDAGLPTALAVSKFIAVGTSHGLIMVFDSKQVLRWCLGSTAVGAQYGAVSALSFNIDSTRLLSGFARGQIMMWDLTNGKLLRTVLDAHPPGTAILHIKFTDDRTTAITSDSGGSVFQLDFRRKLGIRTCESQCLFSGSQGEACTIEPLCTQQSIPEHPMKDVILVAMATLSKAIILVVKPHLMAHFVYPLVGDPSTLPLLSWQFVVIQVSEHSKSVDPVLAFGRDQVVYFAQVCVGVDNINVSVLQKTDLPYKLLCMTWINPRTMVFIDTSEKAHLVDVRTEQEVQVVLDLASVQLAYSTSFYKSLATGGNVSQALAYAGEQACYQSIVTYNNQLVLLGTRGVHIITLRSWSDRINLLVKQRKYKQAVELGLTFYKDTAMAVQGLVWNPQKRKTVVMELLVKVVMQYVDDFMSGVGHVDGMYSSQAGLHAEFYDDCYEVLQVCINYCLETDNNELLFGYLFDRFSENEVTKELYLESLEPEIMDKNLTYISPWVMKCFVDHYERKGMMQNVEACILHLDIMSLDIHQIMSLCWMHGLFDTILYIYNKAMRDFITPLTSLLDRLTTDPAAEEDKQLYDNVTNMGNKILVYISCCLCGRGYLHGELDAEDVPKVRNQVILAITSLHSQQSNLSESTYPYLRTLINFNARDFFNVLSLAFEGDRFNGKEKQRVVDILLLLMVEGVGFNSSQIGILFVFLARQISQKGNSIQVKSILFDQVLESLCSPDQDNSKHEERQQLLLELLNTGVLHSFHGNRDELKLVLMAESAGFYRVVESLHIKKRRFHLAFSCYLKDLARKMKIFNFVDMVLKDESITKKEKELVWKEAVENLDKLVVIDKLKTAHLVYNVMGKEGFVTVLNLMNSDSRILFDFLQGVFELTGPSVVKQEVEVGSRKFMKVDGRLYEKYVELACEFRKNEEEIIEFLRSHTDYSTDLVLSVVKKNNYKEVTCFLLEESGDYSGAFDLKMNIAQGICTGNDAHQIESNIWSIVKYLQRNNKHFSTDLRHKCWHQLLDLVLQKQEDVSLEMYEDDNRISTEQIKILTSQVMTACMPFLPPGLILQRVLSSPCYSSGRYGDLKSLLNNMMDSCNYERVLIKTCANLFDRDYHSQLSRMLKTTTMATKLKASRCYLCFKDMTYRSSSSSASAALNDDSIICFQCGHGYHCRCLSSIGLRRKSVSNDAEGGSDDWICYICCESASKSPSSPGYSINNIHIPVNGTTDGSNQRDERSTFEDTTDQHDHHQQLNQAQLDALQNLRASQKSRPGLSTLMELKKYATDKQKTKNVNERTIIWN
ncbi:hypothetical protein HELRODRAFT_111117 [Helobdella robusta]|uniref:RING-type domain-containing protein n=1 Tax=Helobdella robusta TaxID=6412 RepID=T1EF84_HELRO|nr:hypothetical protein HELRODRAFT_111117 [Helobdella robusta]ESO05633.1 hypothetical protein HELRODRAFT_111117 [Helobdella robusta]